MRELSNTETPVESNDTHVLSFLNIHAGLSDVHRTLGELGSGEFGPLARSQRTEVARLEDTSLGILEELEGLIESQPHAHPEDSVDVHRASAPNLGLATLLYQIEAGKKSGILRAIEGGRVEVFHFESGELGMPVREEGMGTEVRRETLERMDRLLASRTASFEFHETAHPEPVRGLGLDTVRLILDGIGRHYSAAELRQTMDTPDNWHIRPRAMRAISNLPLSAGEMSIVRMLGAGWGDQLAAEMRVESEVLPLAAALHAFGLLGPGMGATSESPVN